MQYIIPQHAHGALSLPTKGREDLRIRTTDRQARLAALDPAQLPMALTFLSGYHPHVFDAILNAVEPCTRPCATETADMEPFCAKCGASVGIFLAHGKDYRHYRGIVTVASKPKPYKTDHAPIVAWRLATDTVAQVVA